MSMIKGSIVALITPFHEDGSVNFTKLGELLDMHVANHTDGILVLGTTGESSTMTQEEDDAVVAFAIERVNHRVPVIVGSGSNDTAAAIMRSQRYEKMGADQLLVITPYYNKASEAGMIAHFTSIADSVNIPIIMYNIPGRTGCALSEKVVAKLSQHKNICGIHEASGNIAYLTSIAKYLNDDFVLYSGNDDMITSSLAMGGSGVISVFANICPQESHDMVQAWFDGDPKKCLDYQMKYLDFIHSLFIEVNPIPIKEAMNAVGMEVGGYRMPLCPLSSEHKEVLIEEMKKVGLL